jgi:hypothetical protein
MSKYHSAEIWENNAEIWEKFIFCRGDMGKYVKNHKRGDMGKYCGDMKFPLQIKSNRFSNPDFDLI